MSRCGQLCHYLKVHFPDTPLPPHQPPLAEKHHHQKLHCLVLSSVISAARSPNALPLTTRPGGGLWSAPNLGWVTQLHPVAGGGGSGPHRSEDSSRSGARGATFQVNTSSHRKTQSKYPDKWRSGSGLEDTLQAGESRGLASVFPGNASGVPIGTLLLTTNQKQALHRRQH